MVLNRPADRVYVDALISLSVTPSHRDALVELMQNSKEVLQCYHVTGAYTFLIKVSCGSMPQLEHLILQSIMVSWKRCSCKTFTEPLQLPCNLPAFRAVFLIQGRRSAAA